MTNDAPPILEHVIAVAMRGDDKYKRWPLGEMIAADDRIEALEAENARLREVAQIVQKLPPGKWEPWSSCSFRRITAAGGPDGGVLHATVHASDGHPDLSWDEETCRALCDLVNGLRAALKENTDE